MNIFYIFYSSLIIIIKKSGKMEGKEEQVIFKLKNDSTFENMLSTIRKSIESVNQKITPDILEQIKDLEKMISETMNSVTHVKKEITSIENTTSTTLLVPLKKGTEIKQIKNQEVEISKLGFSKDSERKLKKRGFVKTDNILDLVDKIYYEYPHEMEDVVIEILQTVEKIHPSAFERYIQSKDETGDNLLMDTAIVKLEKMALYLLSKNKIDLNQQNQHGYTFLMYICKNGWNHIFDLIIPHVNIMIKNEHNESALHFAVENKNEKMVKQFIDLMKDEDLFELSSFQNNALFSVVRGGFDDLSVSIVKRVPNTLFMINKQNDTILHMATRYQCKKLLYEIFTNHIDKFDEDLLNLQNTNGYSSIDLMLTHHLKKELSMMIYSGKLNSVIYDIYSSSNTKMYDQSFIGQMILKKKDISLIEHCLKTIPYTKSDKSEWLYYFCMLTLSYQMKPVFKLFFQMLKEKIGKQMIRTNPYPKTLLMALIEMEWYDYVEEILQINHISEYISILSEEDKKTALFYACEKEKKRKNVIERLLSMTNLAFYSNFNGLDHLQKCKKLVIPLHDKSLNKLFDEKIKELIELKNGKIDMDVSLKRPLTSKYLFQEFSDSDFECREVNRECSFSRLTFEV
jgi:hypothetical protein